MSHVPLRGPPMPGGPMSVTSRCAHTAVLALALGLAINAAGCGSSSPQAPWSSCPPTEPNGGSGGTGGDACAVEGLECTYGDGPTALDRITAVCTHGQFYDSSTTGVGGGSATCPATAPTSGSVC